jgi:general secretion pathway protein D
VKHTGSLTMKFYDRKVPVMLRVFAAIMLAGVLSSCANMQQRGTASQPAANTGRQAESQQPAAATAPVSQVTTASDNTQEEGDSGINREGRIIQLGRFVEDRPAVDVPEGTTVELNYEQEDLRVVFEQLGDELQINMVIDPAIDYRVSVRSSPNNPLQYEDLWPLMRMLAANAGVTIEQAGNVYRFMRNSSNIPAEIVLPGWLGEATSSEVMQITPLTFISVESALAVLNPLLQPEGRIVRLGPANLVGISGSPQQLQRVNALLEIVDDDPFQNQGIQLYELLNSQAADVATELTDVLTLIEGEQSSYQVMALERINSVLVLAPAGRGFQEVTRWIRILDAESQEQVEQLFFYKVKNLNAATLAATLTQVFQQEDSDVPEVATEEDVASITSTAEGDAAQAPAVGDAGAASDIVSANISVTIVADEDTNSLLVRGTPREYRQLLTTINNLDTPPMQVLINAVIGQVTLTDSNQFGVDWRRISQNANTGFVSSRVLPGGLLSDSGVPAQGSGLILSRTFNDGTSIIDATLNAIAQDNEVRLLARPTILATNNQEGEIKVGQAVPIDQGTTVSGNGVTTSNVAYRDVGIVLTITPHINDDGFINLEIFQSLSSLEEGAGVAGNPVFSNQEITTTAVVADQSTITLGGLIQEDDSDQNSGVPYLQKVPVLGGLFSYQQYRSVRRELFVILRPQIISGDDRDNEYMRQFRQTFQNIASLLEEAGL